MTNWLHSFSLQGGSHLKFEQLSTEIQALVVNVTMNTDLKNTHDVISTVHLLLALDPAVTSHLATYSPERLRSLVPTRSSVQQQVLDILSVSIGTLADLQKRQQQGAAGGGGGPVNAPRAPSAEPASKAGFKRKPQPPWSARKQDQKRPRYWSEWHSCKAIS